jgi:hypothetical protein
MLRNEELTIGILEFWNIGTLEYWVVGKWKVGLL